MRYYRKVVDACGLSVELGQRVTSLRRTERDGATVFELESQDGQGVTRGWSARTVVLATGCYDHPNMLGGPR